jgi:hypothetical protein
MEVNNQAHERGIIISTYSIRKKKGRIEIQPWYIV